MNIALPILLLVFGGLTFWLLTDSSLKWYLKASCISAFCIFTIIFWTTIHSFLGWPADANDAPDKLLMHWVIIKEPNKIAKTSGAIYILAESAKEDKSSFLRLFGYSKDRIEPRLYEVPYSRGLHEQLDKEVIPQLKKGQPVMGSLKKGGGERGNGKGKGPDKGKGDGSESQGQEWQFHRLRPSDFLGKPE